MKNFRLAITMLAALMVSSAAYAQFSISSTVTPDDAEAIPQKDTIRTQPSFTNRYFSRAQYRAERRVIRNNRNFIKFNAALTLNQTQYDNWAVGGHNNFNGVAVLFFNHKFSKGHFYVDYSLDARYGLNIQENVSFKNADYFLFNPIIGWNINEHWSYTASSTFRSQFTDSYKSRDDKTIISRFLAPGNLTLSIGLTYKNKPKDENIKVQINPLGGNMIMVFDQVLSDAGAFGVNPGSRTKETFGSSMQVDLNFKFAKDKIIHRAYLYGYTNYKQNNYTELQNWLDFKVGRFVTLNTFVRLIYDELADMPGPNMLQCNYSYGLGLSYTFQNKANKQ